MAKNQKQTDDLLPTEVIRLIQVLVSSWGVWKWIFGSLAALCLVALTWLANEAYSAKISLARVEVMPNQVEKIDSRLQTVEKLLAKLEDLPGKADKLSEVSGKVQTDVATISKAADRVSHLEKSLEEIASNVTDLRTTVGNQGKSIDLATEGVKAINDAVNAQVREFQILKTQSQSLAQSLKPSGVDRKRFSVSIPLPDKPSQRTVAGDSTTFVFRAQLAMFQVAKYKAFRVERFELRSSGRPLDESDAKLPVVLSEVTHEPISTSLVISLHTNDADAFVAVLSKTRLVVNVTLIED